VDPLFLDIETSPTEHGVQYPPPAVCVTATGQGPANLVMPAQARIQVLSHVARGGVVVGHNLPFDLICLGLDAVDPGQTYDTYIRDVLLGAASGRHADASSSLKKIAARAGIVMEKKDKELTLSFRGGMQLADLTEDQRAYALGDVDATRSVWLAQGGPRRVSADEVRQTVLSHDIFRMGRRGVPLDVPYVQAHEMEAATRLADFEDALHACGLMDDAGVVSRKGIQARLKAAGVTKLPKRRATDTREPSGLLASDAATLLATGDPDLAALARYLDARKKWQLWDALNVGPVCRAWWRPLVASGRLSCSLPNLTQVPRVGGYRESVCAPPGYKLVIMDFAALEFRVWAATCQRWLGYSEAAKLLRAGEDVHAYMARAVMEHAGGDFALRRQQCKAMNYGLIGGMSTKRLAETLKVPEMEASRLKRLWESTFWEFGAYKARALAKKVGYPKCEVTLPSGRVRVAFPTEILNVLIQGGGADVTKPTLHYAEKAGLPTVLLPHDEFILLVPEKDARDAGETLLECAERAGIDAYPEVPWDKNEYEITDRWHSKKA
jgi:DNA polymerase I-like protein with 3'-5' exonuclease and polymerase domains